MDHLVLQRDLDSGRPKEFDWQGRSGTVLSLSLRSDELANGGRKTGRRTLLIRVSLLSSHSLTVNRTHKPNERR